MISAFVLFCSDWKITKLHNDLFVAPAGSVWSIKPNKQSAAWTWAARFKWWFLHLMTRVLKLQCDGVHARRFTCLWFSWLCCRTQWLWLESALVDLRLVFLLFRYSWSVAPRGCQPLRLEGSMDLVPPQLCLLSGIEEWLASTHGFFSPLFFFFGVSNYFLLCFSEIVG